MKYFILMTLLALPVGMAHATFEIADPAADIYEAQAKSKEDAVAAAQEQGMKPIPFVGNSSADFSGMLCSIDGSSGECWCIDKKSARRLEMSQGQCKQQVAEMATR